MRKKTRVSGINASNVIEFLDSEQAIAEYLSVVMEENDPSILADTLGTIARARGMTAVAESSGITREALYKALRPGSQPRFETIQRVCTALGLRLTITAEE
jgi:probable addiction module antidote protein